MSNRAFRLLERHQKLDALLRDAQSIVFPDRVEVSRLKKMKLAIKDQLNLLARRTARAG